MQFRINSIDVHHAVYLLLISNLVTPLHFLELQIVNVIYICMYIYIGMYYYIVTLWFLKNIFESLRDYNIFGFDFHIHFFLQFLPNRERERNLSCRKDIFLEAKARGEKFRVSETRL